MKLIVLAWVIVGMFACCLVVAVIYAAITSPKSTAVAVAFPAGCLTLAWALATVIDHLCKVRTK